MVPVAWLCCKASREVSWEYSYRPTQRPAGASIGEVDVLRTLGAADPSASCIHVHSRRHRPSTDSPVNAQKEFIDKHTKKTESLLPQPPVVPKRQSRAPRTSIPR